MRPAVILGCKFGGAQCARAISEESPVQFVVLHESTRAELISEGLDAISIDSWSDEALREHIRQDAADRLQAFAEKLRGDSTLSDHSHDAFQTIALKRMERDMAEAMLLTELVARCVAACDVRLVVVEENFGRDSRTTVLAAKQHGIPSLLVPYEYPGSGAYHLDACDVDRIAAQSARAREALIRMGHEPSKVIVTGRPQSETTRDQACAALRLDPTRPVIGFAAPLAYAHDAHTTRNIDLTEQTSRSVISAFASIAARQPDWQFVVYPHVADGRGRAQLQNFSTAMGISEIAFPQSSEHEFLPCVDALVCANSGLGFQGILRDIPVVNVSIGDGDDQLFEDDDPVIWARAPEDIATAIETAMENTPLRAGLGTCRASFIHEVDERHREKHGPSLAQFASQMIQSPCKFCEPPKRFPGFETALVNSIPKTVENIHIVGGAEKWIEQGRGDANFVAIDKADCVVLSEPLAHVPSTQAAIEELVQQARSQATFILCANHNGKRTLAHGASLGFSDFGLAILLRRCGLAIDQLLWIDSRGQQQEHRTDKTVGIIAVASQPAVQASEYAQTIETVRTRCKKLITAGEEAFASGDLMAAARAFAQAAAIDSGDAVPHNNLATVMHALGRPEDAYRSVHAALHRDPSLESARDNLRAIAVAAGREREAEKLLSYWGAEG